MTAPLDALLWALARALAPGRAVLLLGEPFDAVALLADCAVKELVVVTPDADPGAPAGETAGGAPLRMRADAAERAASKDLIVDRAGALTGEQVTRLLKKAGLYLTATPGPALDALGHRRPVAVGEIAGVATGPAPKAPLCLGVEPTETPVLWVGGKAPLPTLPDVAVFGACATTGSAAAPPAESERSTAPEPDTTRAEVEHLTGELARIAEAYETCREELAERRTTDRRADLVRAAAEVAQGHLLAEIEVLHRRLRELEAPGEDLETQERRRHASEAQTARVLSTLSGLLASQGLLALGPPPPVSVEDAVDLWVGRAVEALSRRGRALATAEGERDALADALAELRTAKAADVDQMPVAEGRAVSASAFPRSVSESEARIQALTAALEAEHGLRLAERVELARCHRQVEAQQRRLEAATETARATDLESARLRMAVATLDEQAHRMRRELAVRDTRQLELEQLVRGHLEMQALLSRALEEAEAGRDAATAQCRLADRNLELLRGELRTRDGQGPIST